VFAVTFGALTIASCKQDKEYYDENKKSSATSDANETDSGDSGKISENNNANGSDWEKAHSSLQKAFNKAIVLSDGYSRVNYKNLSSSSDFESYLDWLERAPISKLVGKSSNDQLNNFRKAFWINVYNACTIQVMIDRKLYNGGSINDGGGAAFDKRTCKVGGLNLSLNQIETGILRNARKRGHIESGDKRAAPSDLGDDHTFYDKRIHYAVNCASSSCPALSNRVFTGKNVNGLLKELEKTYWNKGREAAGDHKQQLRKEGSKVLVNPVFISWYKEDFPNLKSYILDILSSSDKRAGDIEGGAALDAFEYDWDSNATTKTSSSSIEYSDSIPQEISD
jgi:hypothetical protein